MPDDVIRLPYRTINGPFRLLDLTPELRNLIYEYALPPTRVGGLDLRIGKRWSPSPSLTLVSKQVNHEASVIVRQAEARALADVGVRWTVYNGEAPDVFKTAWLEQCQLKELKITIYVGRMVVQIVIKMERDRTVSVTSVGTTCHSKCESAAAEYAAGLRETPRSLHSVRFVGCLRISDIVRKLRSSHGKLIEMGLSHYRER